MKQFYFLLFLVFAIALNSFAQTKMNEGFLLLSGTDTLSIESFKRSDHSIEGMLLFRKNLPVTYRVLLNDYSQPEQLVIEVLQPGMPEGAAPKQKMMMAFKGDSIVAKSYVADTIRRDVVKTTTGAMVYHGSLPIISLLEQILVRAKRIGGREVSVPVFLLSSNGQTVNATIDFFGNDSAYIKFANIQASLQVNGIGYILGGKTFSGQTITRLSNVPDAALAATPADYQAPPNASYTANEVRIQTRAGHILAGTLTVPKNAKGKVPVVITITGSSAHDRDNNTPFNGPYRIFREVADALGEKGIAVLRMDDRGVGHSTGNLEEATTADRADDIREAIMYVRNQAVLDKKNVVLVGLSEGAMIAPMIAQSDKTLKGIVLLAGPASTGDQIMQYQLQNRVDQMKEATKEQKNDYFNEALAAARKQKETKPWVSYFLSHDPLKVALRVKYVPVLILQGSTDKNVPPTDASKLEKAFKKAGNKNVTIQLFENLNHLFVYDVDGNPQNYQNLKTFSVAPEVIKTIVSWVQKQTAL